MIISVPLQPDTASSGGTSGTTAKTGSSGRSQVVPRCHMANAQLSFHGHRDAVKFFVSVPMVMASASVSTAENLLLRDKLPDMLVVSSGEGYIDFRLGEWISGWFQLQLIFGSFPFVSLVGVYLIDKLTSRFLANDHPVVGRVIVSCVVA